MTDLAVRVEDLGKRYRIGQRHQHNTVRETFGALVTAPYSMLRGGPRRAIFSNGRGSNTIWALKHISFELTQGDVLGIIGRNGAGKSTLLKILSRITEPTEGFADVRGRVRSLLEIGTGFHPELTGRENIFLNGAILGMKRTEIARKFDEIVAFGEIDKFIDTPVKWYSSGMHTRLAFSVAVHLEPDILIVDEVLAVGDLGFQRKCLAKMEEVGQHGRTVFFVSHMMPAISRLCKRVLLLDGGRIVADGAATTVMAEYAHLTTGTAADRQWTDSAGAPGSHAVRMRSMRVRLDDGVVSATVDVHRPFAVEMQYEVIAPDVPVVPTFQFFNSHGTCLFVSTSPKPASMPAAAGYYTSTCWVPGDLLAEGVIKVTAMLTTPGSSVVHVYEPDAVIFEIIDDSPNGVLIRSQIAAYPGVVRPRLEWTTNSSYPAPDGVLSELANRHDRAAEPRGPLPGAAAKALHETSS